MLDGSYAVDDLLLDELDAVALDRALLVADVEALLRVGEAEHRHLADAEGVAEPGDLLSAAPYRADWVPSKAAQAYLLRYHTPDHSGRLARGTAPWVALLREAGFSEADMAQWHRDFEQEAPADHQAFLAALGLSAAEIAAIRREAAAPAQWTEKPGANPERPEKKIVTKRRG